MANNLKIVGKFREKFTVPFKKDINWYPGHMNKGMRQMQQKLKSVDCIVEVHDARIPFNGRNPQFFQLLTAIKPHVLVLNKTDLSIYANKKSDDPKIIELLNEMCSPKPSKYGPTARNPNETILVNCRNDKDPGIRKLVPIITELIKNSERYNRSECKDYGIMVIGIPNVGKSTLINKIRHYNTNLKKATTVGSLAGVTRAVQEKIKISNDPKIYIYDTPGVLQPNIKNIEMGLQLALCGTFKDDQIGQVFMADYLLYWLNKRENFEYVKRMGLTEPTDDIDQALIQFAVNLNKFQIVTMLDGTGKIMRPNTHNAACQFIRDFREGLYGPVTFDKI